MSPRLAGIRKSFDGLPVLEGIDLEPVEGGVTVLLGPSGCGKTTLLNLIAGLTGFEEGSRLGFEGLRFSYAFQEPRLLPWLAARDNALFALRGSGLGAAAAGARVDALLAATGLAGFAATRPSRLSGGMRQRLSLVRAFAFPAEILLLDEAFQAVDLKTKLDLMDCFLDLLARERRTAILVTHDVEEAAYLADRVLVLSSRPARVLDRFDIGIPRGERSLGGASLLAAEARLFGQVLGG